jgi:putative peptidoglycan lipid II flippase
MFTRLTSLDLRRYLFDREVLGLMGMTMLVKPIGLINQILIARFFGAGEELDAYALAFFLVIFADGTLVQVFGDSMAPYLIKCRRALDQRLYSRLQNGVLALFMGPGALWMLLLAMAAGSVVSLIGPGLPSPTSDLATRMIVVMALPAMLLLSSNLGLYVLDLHQHFRLGGIVPILNALVMLAALVLFHERFGIWSLPIGFAASSLLQFPLIYLRALTANAVKPVRPAIDRHDLRHIGALAKLALLAQALLMLNMFLDRWFATGLEPGSISSLTYALVLTNFGLVMFSSSLARVMYPRMSESIAAGDLAACGAYIRDNLARAAHLAVPASLAAAFAAPEIVQVLFQRGAFEAADTARTAGVTTMYMLGLPAMIINVVVARIFHALQLLRKKAWLALQFLVTNALLNVALIGALQVQGLALATTLATNLHLLLSLWILHRCRSDLDTAPLLSIVGRSYLMGCATAAAAWLLPLDSMLETMRTTSLLGTAGAGLLKIAVVFCVYAVIFAVWRRRRTAT